MPTMKEQFWANVDRTGNCWLWTACRDRYGYGRLSAEGRRYKAHRASWELHFGPIPEGKGVLHSCDNPPCVRPDHLFLGTQVDNIRDMIAKGRYVNGFKGKTSVRPLRSQCGRGHDYTPENTGFAKAGNRFCKQCKALTERRWKDEHKKKRPAA
jgi:hypothetical protein